MNMFEAILLGLIQGITEFLPVSSSGHLVLMQKILGMEEAPLLFDTMLHLGTLVAVFIVLWKDIWELLKKPFQKLSWLLIAATIPTVIIALLFKDIIESAFQSGATLGWEFLVTAAVLVGAERLASGRGEGRLEKDMNYLDALIIGTLQGIAIMPAVSRSGLTIAGALARKLDRGFAARFSFLLAIPAIMGAAVLQGRHLVDGSVSGQSVTIPMIVGTVVAALVGIVAVKYMMKIIKEGSMRGFAVYVSILGVLVLVDQYLTHLFF
ncbi:undecaprenyl-diphosphate phosphatase [Treponema sp.]